MNSKELIEDLRNNIYCRLKPSRVQGIGVFAIRAIPAGVNPFKSDKIFDELVAVEEAELASLDPAVRQYVLDVCVKEGTEIYLPKLGMNGINISYFLNHAEEPNMETHDEGLSFITKRDIAAGEELTSDYDTYDPQRSYENE